MSNSLLQKSFLNLLCNQQGHQEEPLNYICISQQCQHSPVMCYLCCLEKHPDHQKIALKIFFKQLLSLQAKSEKVVPLCAEIDRIFDAVKRKLQVYRKSFANPDLVMATFQTFRSLSIKYAMDFYNLVAKISELLEQTQDFQKVQKLNDFIKLSYFKYFNEVEQEEWSKLNISEALLNKKIEALNYILQSLHKQQGTHKLNDTQVLNLFPLQTQESRKIRVHFSQDMKPANMTLLSPTHAKMQKSSSERLLILQPCLSSIFLLPYIETMSVKKWGVKIIKLASWIGVGVCHINEIKKANYMFQYSNTGHGNYMISSNGYSWSSYKKQFNSKFEPFAFTTGDIIHLEYNPKERILKFKKQSDPNQPTYELEIQANDDPVHPQINLTGINDQVQIINF